MMPRKMNSRQLNQMMKRFGNNVKNINNVEKVIIQTDTKDYLFDATEVTVMKAQETNHASNRCVSEKSVVESLFQVESENRLNLNSQFD